MKILFPLAWIYSFVVTFRNKAFDWGLLRAGSAGVPVISVGNITTGGTGKTPLVEYLAGVLGKKGKRVGIISRGYGRSTRGVVVVSDGRMVSVNAAEGGDEPVQMARKIPEAVVVVGEKRMDAAQIAVQLGAQVLIMDDGFQHRYLNRDLDIVVIDGSSANFPELVLPAGRARESWASLGRADMVAFSKLANAEQAQVWETNIKKWFQGPTTGFRLRITSVRKADDSTEVPLAQSHASPVFAFSGIGNHGNFIEGLSDKDMTVAGEMEFPDHQMYSHEDLRRITSLKDGVGAGWCITTEKDVVRLRSIPSLYSEFVQSLNLHYAVAEVEFLYGENILLKNIEQAVA